jgi:hypothetical protein
MPNVPLSLDFFLDLETDGGVKVRNYRLLGGHYLVHKIEMNDTTDGVVPIVLPDQFKNRAIKNVVAIKGFVLRSSAPYQQVRAKKSFAWNEAAGQEMPVYTPHFLPVTEAEVTPGQCLLYNSYNVAFVSAQGLLEPLVVIREVDILAVWDPEDNDAVSLSDHALNSIHQSSQYVP